MSKLWWLFVGAICCWHCPLRAQALRNADILDMQAANFTEVVMIAKIKNSSCDLDTTPPALTKLKNAGVPQSIIVQMIDCHGPTTPAVTAQETLKSAKVRVNIYRYKQFIGKALRPSIYCDGTDVARLQSGRSIVLALTPGKHTFRSNDKQSQIELEIKPGQEYYIRIDIATGFWKGHGRLTLVQPEQGTPEFQQTKPADADMIKDKGFVAADFVAYPPNWTEK
jgi:hypothetical protein